MNAQPEISNDDATPKPRSRFGWMDLLGVALLLAGTIYLLRPAHVHSHEARRRLQCKYNLKQIGLALHYYHDKYEEFPPAYTVDEHGKPLHSWRTLILPFMDQEPLYQ